MTAEEAAKLSLRADGVYGFEVANATDGKSKEKGHPMIALTLSFFDNDGARFTIRDWLVHSDSRWAEKKFYDFAQTTGLAAKYAAGTMRAEDCLGCSGWAMVGVEKGKAKGDGFGNFPDRNNVKYYTNKPAGKAAAAPAPAQSAPAGAATGKPAENLDEDVPF